MMCKDMTAIEEPLTILPVKEHTLGKDIFQFFENFIDATQLPVSAMVGRLNGSIAKCTEDNVFPDYLNYHCIIHQQVLCAKMLNTKDIMDVAMKISCSIRVRALQRRLFRAHLEKAHCDHSDFLIHTDVSWFM